MTTTLTLAIPSKGRLMEQTQALLEAAGYGVSRVGSERGYRGQLTGVAAIAVAFSSAGEIAATLKDGRIDLGITGEDLLQETLKAGDPRRQPLVRLGFGRADVIVAVPAAWLDVATMADLDEVSESFYLKHGRRLRIATKYAVLTRRFFAEKGVTGYRIVESLGATEGAPAAGAAEAIVDITTTGQTLAANHLKILDDGVILRSEAVLAATPAAAADPRVVELVARLHAAITL